jgi:hypothetical protein
MGDFGAFVSRAGDNSNERGGSGEFSLALYVRLAVHLSWPFGKNPNDVFPLFLTSPFKTDIRFSFLENIDSGCGERVFEVRASVPLVVKLVTCENVFFGFGRITGGGIAPHRCVALPGCIRFVAGEGV